jgi:adhesin transport system outer membrane protein
MDIHPLWVLGIMKYRKFVTLAILVFLSGNRGAFAETITESVKHALSHHPSVQAAIAGKTISQENMSEARSGLFPEISTNVSFGRVYADTATSRGLSVNRGAAYSGLGEGSAAITQPLFDGFETSHRIDAAQARLQSATYNVADVQENLAYTAIQAHLAVLQAQSIVDKTNSYYDVIEDYLSRIQLMVDEGVADESEAAQARNISLMLKSTLTDYEGQLDAALARYAEVTGSMPQGGLVKPALNNSDIPLDVNDAVEIARQNHPLMKANQKSLEAAESDIGAEKAGIYPEVDGELSYLKRDQKEDIGGEVVDGRALIKMSWDFETGGAYKARTRRSKAQYSEILSKNQETKLQIEGDLRRAYSEYETAKKQMDLIKKRETVTKELFEAYTTQFEGARVRLLQLMQAENQLFNAQLESITSEYRYYLAHYAILASAGELLQFVDASQTDLLVKKTVEMKTTSSAPEENKVYSPVVPENIETDMNVVSEETELPQENVQAVSPSMNNKLDERVIVDIRK